MSPGRVSTSPNILIGWALGAVFFLYAWVLRVQPSVMITELMRDFSVGGALLGQLSALYFYGYSGVQIPAGMLLDRFGARRLMCGAALCCFIGSIGFLSEQLWLACIGRFLIGLGCGFSLISAMSIAGRAADTSRFALLSGIAMMMGMFGGMLGQAPVRLLVEANGWRPTVMLFAIPALLIALLAWLMVRDPQRERKAGHGLLAGLGQVLRSRQMWLCALAGLGANGPLLAFAALWGVPYLQIRLSIGSPQASALTSLTFLGYALGAPLLGWLSDHIGRRKPSLFMGSVLSTGCLGGLLYLPQLQNEVAALLCLSMGLGGGGMIVCYAIARESHDVALAGTALGFINAMVTAAGVLYQPAVGWLLDWSSQRTGAAAMLNPSPHGPTSMDAVSRYALADFRFALGLTVLGGILGLVAACLLRETHTRRG